MAANADLPKGTWVNISTGAEDIVTNVAVGNVDGYIQNTHAAVAVYATNSVLAPSDIVGVVVLGPRERKLYVAVPPEVLWLMQPEVETARASFDVL